MSTKKSFSLPERLGAGAKMAVNATLPRQDFSVQFAHLHVTVENTPPHESLRGTAVAVGIDERIRRMHEAREDKLRRRGSN